MICTRCFVASSYNTNDVEVVGGVLLGYYKDVPIDLLLKTMYIGLQCARMQNTTTYA